MIYFVTGGTGQTGRILVSRLLDRDGTVYMLLPESFLDEFHRLRQEWGVSESRLVPVIGDLSQKRLGVSQQVQGTLKHRLDHFFHLATAYQWGGDGAAQVRHHVDGVRRALALAENLHAGCFHLLSSVAVSGRYRGTYTEAMFDVGQRLDQSCYANYHHTERLVRDKASLPWRIYRPGCVVGDSRSGESSDANGAYHFFESVRSLGESLPEWGQGVVPAGGQLNLVPADFVATALDSLAHLPGYDRECFMLTHPEGSSAGQVFSRLLGLAGGPNLHVVAQLRTLGLSALLRSGTPGHGWLERYLAPCGLPVEALELATSPTHYDGSQTQLLLDQQGIRCPDFDDYAEVIWSYWLDHLSSASSRGALLSRIADGMAGRRNPAALSRTITGKVIVITGATSLHGDGDSSGLSYQCALKLSRAGGTVILISEDARRLRKLARRASREGFHIPTYVQVSTAPEACARLVDTVESEHGHVDVLLNCEAIVLGEGLIERQKLAVSMQSLQQGAAFVQVMTRRRAGHVVTVGRRGALGTVRGFAKYALSCTAFQAFSRFVSAELATCRVHFSALTIPASQQTAARRWFGTTGQLSAEDAAERVLKLLVEKPGQMSRVLAVTGNLARALAPELGSYSVNGAQRWLDADQVPPGPRLVSSQVDGEASLAHAPRAASQDLHPPSAAVH